MTFYVHHENQFYCLKKKYPKEFSYIADYGKYKKHTTGQIRDIITLLENHKEYSRNFIYELLSNCFERCTTVIVNLDKG